MTTVYAHTDTELYSVDPSTLSVSDLGAFTLAADGGAAPVITDLAVNVAGDVYVNSETALFSVTLPTSPPAPVALTQVTTFAGLMGARMYALAFVPKGVLDPNVEVLLGGDGAGIVWAIDPSTGATTNLGSFGPDPVKSGNVLGLSGDMVFYIDANGAPIGLATIRSCTPGGTGCGQDYLAAISISNLKTAYTTKTAATTLLAGVYGAPDAGTGIGPGTGFSDVFGLAAWGGSVFGFTRHTSTVPATFITIDTTTGVGTATPNTFTFTNGWSGAGVSTSVVAHVPPPT